MVSPCIIKSEKMQRLYVLSNKMSPVLTIGNLLKVAIPNPDSPCLLTEYLIWWYLVLFKWFTISFSESSPFERVKNSWKHIISGDSLSIKSKISWLICLSLCQLYRLKSRTLNVRILNDFASFTISFFLRKGISNWTYLPMKFQPKKIIINERKTWGLSLIAQIITKTMLSSSKIGYKRPKKAIGQKYWGLTYTARYDNPRTTATRILIRNNILDKRCLND